MQVRQKSYFSYVLHVVNWISQRDCNILPHLFLDKPRPSGNDARTPFLGGIGADKKNRRTYY